MSEEKLREELVNGGDIGPLCLWLRLEERRQQSLAKHATRPDARSWYEKDRDNFATTIETLRQRHRRVAELEDALRSVEAVGDRPAVQVARAALSSEPISESRSTE